MTRIEPERVGGPAPEGFHGDRGWGVDATAGWLFGIALMLVTEETAEAEAIHELLSESDGNLRILEGAYGRGVVLMSEFPDDPRVRRTVDLLAKTLRQGLRLAGYAQPA